MKKLLVALLGILMSTNSAYTVTTQDLAWRIKGKYVQIKSLKNNKYLAARWVKRGTRGKAKGRWRLKADTTNKLDPSTKFYIVKHKRRRKDKKGLFYIRSHIAGGLLLESKKRRPDKGRVRFYSSKKWKRTLWRLDGKSLKKCSLWSIKSGRYLKSEGKWGVAWATGAGREEDVNFSIELISNISSRNKKSTVKGISWAKVSRDQMAQVAVGNEENIFGIKRNGQLYKWNPKKRNWEKETAKDARGKPLYFRQISAADDGTVVGISSRAYKPRRTRLPYRAFQRKWAGNWAVMRKARRLKRIDAGNSRDIWAVGFKNNLFKWNGRRWVKKNRARLFIDVALDKYGTTVRAIGVNPSRHKRHLKIAKVQAGMPLLRKGKRHEDKFATLSVGTKAEESTLWAIGPSGELAYWDKDKRAFDYVGEGIRNVSAGGDGTVWATAFNRQVIEIAPGPSGGILKTFVTPEQEKEKIKQEEEKRKQAEFNTYVKKLNTANAQTNFNTKINQYKKLKSDILKSAANYEPFEKQMKSMIYNRKSNQLKKLQELASAMIDETNFLLNVLQRGFDEAKQYTTLKPTESELKRGLESIRQKFEDYKKTAKTAVPFTKLLARADAEFDRLAQEAKTIREGTKEFKTFKTNTHSFIEQLEDLVTNMKKNPTVSLKKLFVTKIKNQNIDKFTSWFFRMSEISDNQKELKKIKSLIDKVIAFEEKKAAGLVETIPVEPTVSGKPTITGKKEIAAPTTLTARKIVDDFKKKLDEAQEDITEAIIPGPDQTKWLNNLSYLTNNVAALPLRKGLGANVVSKIKTGLLKLEDKDVDTLSQDIHDALESYEQLITTTVDYMSSGYFTGQEPGLKTSLNRGKAYYLKMVNNAKRKTRLIIAKARKEKALFKIWLKKITFLVKNMKDRTTTEQEAIWKLKTEIEKYVKLLPANTKAKINNLLKEMLPTYLQAFKDAQAATELTEKLKLYEKALKNITAKVTLEERSNLVKDHFALLTKNALATEEVKGDTQTLNQIISLLTKTKQTLIKNLTESEQTTIKDEIDKLIKSLNQPIAILKFKTSLNKAKEAANLTQKLKLYQTALDKVSIKLPTETAIELFDTHIKPLVTEQAMVKETIKKNVKILKSIKSLLTKSTNLFGKQTVDPFIKEIDALIKAQQKVVPKKITTTGTPRAKPKRTTTTTGRAATRKPRRRR